jgi:hypothetical protein
VLANKAGDKCPEELENIIGLFLSSKSNKVDFHNFIDNALNGKRGMPSSSPVGFLNRLVRQPIK